MIIIKNSEMSVLDRYKYIKREENKEEYQKEGYKHKFIESQIVKEGEMEYRYFSSYKKDIEIDNKIYSIFVYEDYNNYYELDINNSIFRGFKVFPSYEVIKKFTGEIFDVV